MHFDSDSDKYEKNPATATSKYPNLFMLLDPSIGLMSDQLLYVTQDMSQLHEKAPRECV